MRSRKCLSKKDAEDVIQEMADANLLEDTGERRPNRDGVLEIVWRRTRFAELVEEYETMGLTNEEACARAKTVVDRPH